MTDQTDDASSSSNDSTTFDWETGDWVTRDRPRESVIDRAVEAFRRGWSPVPLKPGTKAPKSPGWTKGVGDTEEDVRAAFEEDDNLGLILGGPGRLVDIDLDDPLIARIARELFPETPFRYGRDSSRTRHLFYRIRDEDELPRTRGWSDKLTGKAEKGAVLELRSTGHQTMIPPSVHDTTGVPLDWVVAHPGGHLPEPAEVQSIEVEWWSGLTMALYWLVRAGIGEHGTRHEAYLNLAGGLLRWPGHPGQVHPVWEHFLDHAITALQRVTDDEEDRTDVVPSTIRRLEENKSIRGFPSLIEVLGPDSEALVRAARTEFRALEELQGYGVEVEDTSEWRAAALDFTDDEADPEAVRNPLDERTNSWAGLQMSQWEGRDLTPPKPTLMTRTDGQALLYPGRVNLLFGRPEAAKSFIALRMLLDHLSSNPTARALYLDMEDDPETLATRSLLLESRARDGATWELLSRMTYVRPEGPLDVMLLDPPRSSTPKANREFFRDELAHWQPEVIVVDGVTALYGMHGLDTNKATDTDKVTSWLKALCGSGDRTVLVIDHVNKGSQRGSMATGSQHKIAMVQGTALQAWVVRPPRPDSEGLVKLLVVKDRPGEVRRVSLDPAEDGGEQWQIAADVTVHSTEHHANFRIEPPTQFRTVADWNIEQQSRAEQERDRARDAVLKLMAGRKDGLSFSELVFGLKSHEPPVTQTRLRKILRDLRDDGTIVMTGDRKGARYGTL